MIEPPPLALDLDRERRVPLHRQLYDQLREAILTGRLEPGRHIPATRTLARELDISRTTALTAVGRLKAEGFLEARVGAGTWVSKSIEEELRGYQDRRGPSESSGPRPVSERARRLHGLVDHVPASWAPSRPFQVGVPALNAFPGERWARLVGRRWRTSSSAEIWPVTSDACGRSIGSGGTLSWRRWSRGWADV